MPSSRRSSQPRNRTQVSYVSLYWQAGSLPPGKPEETEDLSKLTYVLQNNWSVPFKNTSIIKDNERLQNILYILNIHNN